MKLTDLAHEFSVSPTVENYNKICFNVIRSIVRVSNTEISTDTIQTKIKWRYKNFDDVIVDGFEADDTLIENIPDEFKKICDLYAATGYNEPEADFLSSFVVRAVDNFRDYITFRAFIPKLNPDKDSVMLKYNSSEGDITARMRYVDMFNLYRSHEFYPSMVSGTWYKDRDQSDILSWSGIENDKEDTCLMLD